MKSALTLMLFLLFIGITAQNLSEVNKDLSLPDSLTYKNEIRIYQGGGKVNFVSLFRMFKDESGKWTAEFYENYNKKRTLKYKNDLEFIWKNILRTKIEFLPNMNDIFYKLSDRGKVELVGGKYEINQKLILICDGLGYKVQIKTDNKINTVNYSNPRAYFKHYQEVDELIYFNELLNLIKSEFELW